MTRFLPESARRTLRDYRDLWRVRHDILRGRQRSRTFAAREIDRAPSNVSSAANPLETFFDSNLTGPGIWKWRPYFDAYHRHLARFRQTPVHVLEIGIYSGGSLRMWRDYFGPTATIYGLDIQEACRAYESSGIQVFIGDQGDPAFWNDFRRQVPVLDVVIDDGGHRPDQQITTLDALLPHLRPGGVYVCEDVHAHTFHRFHAYVYGLSQDLHALEFTHPHGDGVYDSEATPIQRSVAAVHHYPCLTVIERTETPRAVIRSDKRGTEWAPFRPRHFRHLEE